MTREEEKTLNEALQYTHIPSLPELYDEKGGDVWIKALVKVTKLNGHTNFAVAKIDEQGKPRIVKDFGVMAGIVSIDEIRPYYFLKEQYIKTFKDKKEIVSYLAKVNPEYSEEELSKKKKDEIKQILYNGFIKQQLFAEKQ